MGPPARGLSIASAGRGWARLRRRPMTQAARRRRLRRLTWASGDRPGPRRRRRGTPPPSGPRVVPAATILGGPSWPGSSDTSLRRRRRGARRLSDRQPADRSAESALTWRPASCTLESPVAHRSAASALSGRPAAPPVVQRSAASALLMGPEFARADCGTVAGRAPSSSDCATIAPAPMAAVAATAAIADNRRPRRGSDRRSIGKVVVVMVVPPGHTRALRGRLAWDGLPARFWASRHECGSI